ncbi:hypothetical protein MHU86_19541 [Fragilaria crotonensis]|nr:hypothetical protein MHU86_19541 [Fragilaria crotonensis]
MTIDGDDATASSACSDEGATMTMMEVEQSAEDFVEMLLKDLDHNSAIAISLGAIQESCLARGIQLSQEARTEVSRIVSKYWE